MISQQEHEYKPDVVFPPGETLQETLEALGMSRKDLAARTGLTAKHINEIIKGRASISEDTALRLERVLGIDASFWRNLEHQYRRFLAEQSERKELSQKQDWLSNFPLKAMIQWGWIRELKDPVDQLSELLSYFRVASWESWENVWAEEAAFRKSPAFQSNPYAIAAWLRRGEILAESIECEEFNAKDLRSILGDLKRLSRLNPDEYLPRLQEMCAQYGVAVVFLPELPETRVCGVTRWLRKNKALVQLSDRYKKDDHFWFTFFHEVGHVLQHRKKEVFIEEEGGRDKGPQEEEADRFAANTLIPSKEYSRLVQGGKPKLKEIEDFAERLGIAPGIVVGRLQHDQILDYSQGNKLKQSIKLT